jgi:hypothetical protein
MASSISVIPACSALSQCLDDVEGLVDARPVVDEQREKSSMQSRLLRRCLQELANLSTGQPDRLGLLGGLASADLVDAGVGVHLNRDAVLVELAHRRESAADRGGREGLRATRRLLHGADPRVDLVALGVEGVDLTAQAPRPPAFEVVAVGLATVLSVSEEEGTREAPERDRARPSRGGGRLQRHCRRLQGRLRTMDWERAQARRRSLSCCPGVEAVR